MLALLFDQAFCLLKGLARVRQSAAGHPAGGEGKTQKVLQLFHDCKVNEWALQLKNRYLDEALNHLEDVAVLSKRKEPLMELAHFLIHREN